jgi:hypothetical protein
MSFFVLNNHLFDDDIYAICEDLPGIKLGEGDDCDRCGSPITPMIWLATYEVRVTKKRLGDFIFGDVNPSLSPRSSKTCTRRAA